MNAMTKVRPSTQSQDYRNAVESLTNHERNQWARAGYPGQRQQDPEAVKRFKTVNDWLETHDITKLPTGHALGLSEIERATGRVATDGAGWTETVRKQQSSEVSEIKRKQLRQVEKSASGEK